MKQIIIFLLVIILAVMGYNYYKKYQRFNPPNYEYVISENIAKNSNNKALLLDYYEAVESLNGYVITQWSSNDIDVRNPGDDNAKTEAAVSEYRKKLANVKFYEAQLLNPKKVVPTKGELSEAEKKNILIREMFSASSSSNPLRLGDRGAFVFEIQKILVKNGFDIPVDGVYKNVTFEALRSFEEKNGLYPDGKLDAITLDALLR